MHTDLRFRFDCIATIRFIQGKIIMSARYIVLVITLFIYVLIIIAFNKARRKYSGGKIGDVINLILITVVLLFIADYTLLLSNFFSENTIYTLQTLLRTIALSFLAYGGTRVASR